MIEPAAPRHDPEDALQEAWRGMGELLTSIPVRLGFLPGPDQVVVTLRGENRRDVVLLRWPHRDAPAMSARELADSLQEQHGAQLARENGGVLVIGFGGPEVASRIDSLREAIHLRWPDGIRVGAAQVQGSRWRLRGAAGPGQWRPLPEPSPDLLVQGYPAPAPDMQTYLQQYDPATRPTFEPLPDRLRTLIDSTPPSLRAELALRCLRRLADRESHPLDAAVLAHTLGCTAVSHGLVAYAFPDRARTGALVDVYRGAPAELRPAATMAAATALWLRGRIMESKHVLTHLPLEAEQVDGSRPSQARLGPAVTPESIATAFGRDAAAGLEAADVAWNDQRAARPGSPAGGREYQPAPPRYQVDPDWGIG